MKLVSHAQTVPFCFKKLVFFFYEQDALRDSDYRFLPNSLRCLQLHPFCSFFMGNEKQLNIITLIR